MVGVPPLTHDRLSNLLTKSDYALTVSMAVQFYTLSEKSCTTVHQPMQVHSFKLLNVAQSRHCVSFEE